MTTIYVQTIVKRKRRERMNLNNNVGIVLGMNMQDLVVDHECIECGDELIVIVGEDSTKPAWTVCGKCNGRAEQS